MKTKKQNSMRCWEFFHCTAEKHNECLMRDVKEWRCWLVNITCCKMNKDTPMPLSVKHIICKNCEYYKFHNPSA